MLDYLKEAMALFKELTPENQVNLLTYTRLAHTAESSVKKSLSSSKDIPSAEATAGKEG